LVVGSPARVRGWVCACGTDLSFDADDAATCAVDGRRFRRSGDVVTAA
jgi:hypothetical protein